MKRKSHRRSTSKRKIFPRANSNKRHFLPVIEAGKDVEEDIEEDLIKGLVIFRVMVVIILMDAI